jgi:predicted regulator of Ras-like GTPase activity (Roadblock/LC7/MglB family)
VTEIDASMRQLIDHVVDGVPGVAGALVSSKDGFVLATRLPESADPSAVAAMSAASLGLATRLVQLAGDTPVTISHHRSTDGQVFVFAISHVAVLTVLADASADANRIRLVGREITTGLQRVFNDAAAAATPAERDPFVGHSIIID